MKNNLIYPVILVLLVLLLSSCNQEDIRIIDIQKNISTIEEVDVSSKTSISFISSNALDDTQVIPGVLNLYDLNRIIPQSSINSLAIGILFDSKQIEIDHIKISNSLYNWSFNAEKFEIDNSIYYGSSNLIFPNNIIIEEPYLIEVFFSNGKKISKEFDVSNKNEKPQLPQIGIFSNYLLLSNNLTNIDKEKMDINSFTEKVIQNSNYSKSSDNNILIKVFNNKTLISKIEVPFDEKVFNESFISVEIKDILDATEILIAKKNSQNNIYGKIIDLK